MTTTPPLPPSGATATRPAPAPPDAGRNVAHPVRALVMALLFLTFPAALLVYQLQDMEDLARGRWRDEVIERAAGRLPAEQRAAHLEMQIRSMVTGLSQRLEARLGTGSVAAAVQAETPNIQGPLAARLPPHDLMLVGLDHDTPTILFRQATRRFLHTAEEINGFARWAATGVLQPPDLAARLGRRLGCPLSLSEFQRTNWRGGLRFFAAGARPAASIWDVLRTADPSRALVLLCFLDLARVPADLGPRILVRDWRDPTCGVAFLPQGAGRKMILSSLVREQPALVRRLRNSLGEGHPLEPVEEVGGWMLCAGHAFPEFAYRVVLAFPPPTAEQLGIDHHAPVMAALGLLWIIGAWFLTERLLFGRGPASSVSLVLLANFSLVALLPVTGALGPGRRYLADHQRTGRISAERELGFGLDRLDGLANVVHARLFQHMREAAKAPSTAAALQNLERNWVAGGCNASDTGPVLAFLHDFVTRAARGDRTIMPTRALLMGPQGLTGQWDRQYGRQGAPAEMIDTTFPRIGREFLGRFSPTISFHPPGTAAQEGKMAGMVQEEARRMLLQMVGASAFSSLTHYPAAVSRIRIDVVNFYSTSFPITIRGVLRYGLSLFWSEDLFLDTFFRTAFGPGGPWVDRPDRGFFAIEAMGNSATTLQGLVSRPPGIGSHPALVDLLQGARTIRAPMRQYRETDQTLLEARPSQYVGRYYLAGWRSIAHLSEEATASWNRFLWAVLGMLALTLLVAGGAARYILDPLGVLLDGIEQIKAGDFTVRLRMERSDEFGALGGAFDTMARKLGEMSLLGRYVSGSVRRAIESEGTWSRAQKGQQTSVTILFLNLLEFDRFEEAATPDQVFRVLNQYLQAVDRAVQRHGGEIDKVIGEQILVLFPHEELGSGEKAVAAALAVAGRVRASLVGKLPLELVMGLTSGPAIVGIIGARGVHVDFTAIGDTVNLASRLATLAATTTGTRLVLSGNSLELAGPAVKAERLPFKRVKGKTQEVEAWLLLEPGASTGGKGRPAA
ncbi:MAG: HAMP domain-containing protein [Candidatus Riflebacteria bacterium]|nr:HAMP domain-containing protein [Candidatus Riflebacteria bacterium]